VFAMPVRVLSSRLAWASLAVLLTTFAAYRFQFNLSAATSVHLFLVAAIALRWGMLEASVVSILSVGCLDYFFTSPLFAFSVSDPRDWVALGTFETVALLVSTLSNQANRHARASEQHQARLQKLYELSNQILLLDQKGAVEQQLADLIHSTFGAEAVAVWNAYDLKMGRSGPRKLSDQEMGSIDFVNTNTDDPAEGISRLVLRLGTKPIGALLLGGHTLEPVSLKAVATLAAIAIERSRAFSTEAVAEAARQSEQLRSAILDGLAHAFKSPLTAIRTSSSGLLAMNTLTGTELKLVSLIDRQAGNLSDLASHLVLTAKLDTRELKLRCEEVDLAELIQGCVDASSQELDGHTIAVPWSERRTLVWVDRKLLQMVFVQLLDNATKYGTPGAAISIAVDDLSSEGVIVKVNNAGSFIPPGEREKVFQRFYRCSGSAGTIAGTGIGLSVVKRIVEAHQGRTWVNSDLEHGTTFMLTLPRRTRRERYVTADEGSRG